MALVELGAALVAGCLAAPSAGPRAQEPGPAPAPLGQARTEQVVTVSFGVSGSFGRTKSSLALELGAAARAGVDAVFWAASDALLGTGREVTRFSFDAAVEPVDAGQEWTALPLLERGHEKRVTPVAARPLSREEREFGAAQLELEQAFDEVDTRDGSPSLRLAMAGSSTEAFRDVSAYATVLRGGHRRSLARGLRARLHVLPQEQSSDARAFVEFGLSEQPTGPRGKVHQQDVLHYYLSDGAGPIEVVGGKVLIPVPYQAGVWNELALELSADAAAHTVGGLDNTLYAIRVGVESRFQSPAAARFDELVLEVELSGELALAQLAELLRAQGEANGGAAPRSYLGLAIDTLRGGTLFELGTSARPADYGALLERADPELPGPPRLALVAEAHGRGSLVAHGDALAAPFQRPEHGALRLERLSASRLDGADLLVLEASPDTFVRQVELWDGLAAAGVYPVGIGAGGELLTGRHQLITGVRGLLTFVLSASSGQGQLLAALRRGRATFGDPSAFRGALDLESARGFSMGRVVLTDRGSATLTPRRIGKPAEGEVLAWVSSRGELEGFPSAEPRTLELALPDFARLVVLGARARPVAYSNALHFVRAFPPGGLPAERAGFDLGGVRCVDGTGLRLLDARTTEDGRGVVVAGRAERPGSLRLALEADEAVDVLWDGLSGSAERRGTDLWLIGLTGEGTLTVRRRR